MEFNLIAVKSFQDVGYLSYIRDEGEADGYMRFMDLEVTSPYAKFEVENSSKEGLVHIRSCANNKYWQRIRNESVSGGPWIWATAKEKEEDESKETCTLFNFISVDPVQNKFRIMHFQSGCYVCKWGSETQEYDQGMMCYYKETDWQGADVYTIIDWRSLLILPRHLALKGDNGLYLCFQQGKPMYFGTGDIGEPTVTCEIIPTKDGNIRIRCSKTGKFFRLDSGWIWADSDDTTTNNVYTLFRPVKVDEQTIALINLGNNNFCKRLTVDDRVSALAAVITSVTDEAKIRVEEAVMTREIYDVTYDVDNSRVYNQSVLVVSHNSVSNCTDQPSTMDVKLAYTDTKTSSWKTDFSLTLGMKSTVDMGIPLIADGSVEMSAQVQAGVEWGKAFETSTELEVETTVIVPPMTRVTVNLVATKGLCDVPFYYLQRDTLYGGASVVTKVEGGTYSGSNYYSMNFQTTSEVIPSVNKT